MMASGDVARRKRRKDMTEMDVLIERCEKMASDLGPPGPKEVDIEDMDEFTRMKKLAARQVSEVRKLISERDECLEASSGSSGRMSVELSARIREQLKTLKETHTRMQNALHQEEKDRNKGGKALLEANADDIAEHVRIVELTAKHIEECEVLDKRRYQVGGARGGSGRPGLITGGSAMGGARGGGAGAAGDVPMKDMGGRGGFETDLDPIDADGEVGQGLAQIRRQDQELDQGLEVVAKGVQRLKGIALDQQNELKVQEGMIEELDTEMDRANAALKTTNHKMKDVLAQAGGTMQVRASACPRASTRVHSHADVHTRIRSCTNTSSQNTHSAHTRAHAHRHVHASSTVYTMQVLACLHIDTNMQRERHMHTYRHACIHAIQVLARVCMLILLFALLVYLAQILSQ